MIDIDDFKKFNDQHGHHEGDRAPGEVAALLAKKMGVPAVDHVQTFSKK